MSGSEDSAVLAADGRAGGRTGEVVVSVSEAKDPQDTGTLARWSRRAAALDGRLDRHLDGVTLVLPWSSARTTRAGSPVARARSRAALTGGAR